MAALRFKDQPRAITEDGALLPGASLWFTASGTDDDTPVYADPALTTPLSNPLRSDSAARFRPFWFDPAIDYRARLLDPTTDAVVWERDPVGDIVFPGTFPVRPLDDAGEAMPLSQLTFWNARTTSLQTVFADEALTEELEQPVVAPIDGQFSTIYVDNAKGLRVRFEDVDGVLVYDIDDMKVAPNGNFAPPSAPVLSIEGVDTAQLSWTTSVPDIGDSITGYRVFRSVSGGSFGFLASTLPAVLEYEDTTTEGGIVYDYHVVGVGDEGGDSAPSNEVEFKFGGDPYFSNIVLLLQIQSGVLHENTGVPSAVNIVGAGVINNVQTLFGESTFDNPPAPQKTNYVEAIASAGTYAFPGELTWEGWFKIDDAGVGDYFSDFFSSDIDFNDPDYWQAFINSSHAFGLNANPLGAVTALGVDLAPAFAGMAHIAYTRDASGVLRLFVNGVKVKEQAGYIGRLGATNAVAFYIGRGATTGVNDFDLDGHWGEIRITKGVARYTSNFTPPNAPFAPF